MLAEAELTALRRMVTQSAQDGGLLRCRIRLPGGGVIADANPSGITLRELPEKWPDGVAAPQGDDARTLAFPLMVAQRGTALLEIVPQEDPVTASYWLTQSGIGAICIGPAGHQRCPRSASGPGRRADRGRGPRGQPGVGP
jgi:hypothetical protein